MIAVEHPAHLQAADRGRRSHGLRRRAAAQGRGDRVVAGRLYAMHPAARTHRATGHGQRQAARACRTENAEILPRQCVGDLVADRLHPSHAARRKREGADLVARIQFGGEAAQALHDLGADFRRGAEVFYPNQMRAVSPHLAQLALRRTLDDRKETPNSRSRAVRGQRRARVAAGGAEAYPPAFTLQVCHRRRRKPVLVGTGRIRRLRT